MAVADQQTGVPDGWEVVAQPTTQAPTRIGFGLSVTPEVADAAKQIDARQAADAERAKNWPADMASRLPASLQFPVAAGLSLLQPAAEIASVVSGAPAALRAGRAATEALSKPADLLLDLLVKKIGHDPDALELAATRMRLQAARSTTRQARMAADMAKGSAATAPASAPAAPVETAAASPTPPTVPAAPTPAATAAPATDEIGKLLKALQAEGLSTSEVDQAFRWLKQGVDSQTIWRRIQDARALQSTGAFANLPTDTETAATVAMKNAKTTPARGGTKPK